MKITIIAESLSSLPTSLQNWEEQRLSEIKNHADQNDVILYPELNLVALSTFFNGEVKEQYQKVANYLQNDFRLKVDQLLGKKDLLLCLGTGPRKVGEKLYNSAYIYNNGNWLYQDKLHLTPWEIDFSPGNTLHIFTFKGLRCCVAICYDIEQPGLSLYMKEKGIDCILVPSATVNRNGSQRVNRCANARSVELGAIVLTCPLIGQSACELVDHSEGRIGLFLPSQEKIDFEQEVYSHYSNEEKLMLNYNFNENLIFLLKQHDSETKPYLKKDIFSFH
jgi:predicted amidohydrolase